MKKITIYSRTITERTGFRKYPFKDVQQITIAYGGKTIENHYEDIDNPRLKIKFRKILETRNSKEFKKFVDSIAKSRTTENLWLKEGLNKLGLIK